MIGEQLGPEGGGVQANVSGSALRPPTTLPLTGRNAEAIHRPF
jgi:hypothetical protein